MDTIISTYINGTLIREQACFDESELTPSRIWSFIRNTNAAFRFPPDCTYKIRTVDDAKTLRMRPFDTHVQANDETIRFIACPSCQVNLHLHPQDLLDKKCGNCTQLLT